MKIFVSYCHRQGSWVCGSLVPCLKAGGADVLIDKERFRAGHALVGEMDAVQDAADKTLAVLSSDYLASEPCRHELERAIAHDPEFAQGLTIPVMFEDCALPDLLKKPNPLWVDLRDRRSESGWKLLLEATGAELGCKAVRWLEARDELVTLLQRNRSVNFVVPFHLKGPWPRWKELLKHVQEQHFPGLGCVDLERPGAASRRGLVELILEAIGQKQPVPNKPHDLEVLDRALNATTDLPRLALLHFDMTEDRLSEYGVDLFAAVRNLIEERRLVVLVQSRRPFVQLVPREHPLSMVQLNTVELDGG